MRSGVARDPTIRSEETSICSHATVLRATDTGAVLPSWGVLMVGNARDACLWSTFTVLSSKALALQRISR